LFDYGILVCKPLARPEYGVQEAVIGVVFLATIGGLYFRPFGARDWQVALAGAVAAWILGPLSFREGLLELRHSWNIVAFFAGLMLLGAGAEAAGLYARLARWLRHSAPGRPRLLRTLLAGTGITGILSNDATPLVLTPAVFAASDGMTAASASAFATTFAADGASLLLPISNPVNLLFYERFDLGLPWYLGHVLPAAAAGIAALGLVLWLQTRPRSNGALSPAPPALLRTRKETYALVTVAALAVAYVWAAVVRFKLGAVTLVGGLVLLGGEALLERETLGQVRRHIAPGVLVFVASLLLLIEAVSRAGVLDGVANVLEGLSRQPPLLAILGTALLAAVLSNLMNNWPAALLVVATIGVSRGNQDALIVGSLIGCTIGANFTMVGSLSTVFWQNLLRQRGVVCGPAEYARQAALPTLAAVAAACFVAAALL
jgi:arsenical pump membrane protein